MGHEAHAQAAHEVREKGGRALERADDNERLRGRLVRGGDLLAELEHALLQHLLREQHLVDLLGRHECGELDIGLGGHPARCEAAATSVRCVKRTRCRKLTVTWAAVTVKIKKYIYLPVAAIHP